MKLQNLLALLAFAVAAQATEFHVATKGNDANSGSKKAPFHTIQRAADAAQPGDTITVHAGVYRERINPPRGGRSDKKRITYQAAPGEEVVITGSEIVKNWERVTNDTWKVTIPNSFFGKFNPYADRIHGDWYISKERQFHTGCVYLNGDWLIEAASHLNEVFARPGKTPLWFARVDNAEDNDYLLNLAGITVGENRIAPDAFSAKHGELHPAASAEGGPTVGWIRAGSWLKFAKVNFATNTESVSFRAASVTGGGNIAIHADTADGQLLGTVTVADTGDWKAWQTFTARIAPTSGEQDICLVFRSPKSDTDNTTIWAQFPGVDPNAANVEISVRQTVFTPAQTGINFLTVRGFELRAAAAPWSPPTAAQIGIISAFWCKGWIIENNRIRYSPTCGVALGKYGDEWDNGTEIQNPPEWLQKEQKGGTGGYVATTERALKNGWNKATIGSHIVRNNEISDCEQTGIVGSLGCAFSTIAGNEIHDIHVRNLYGGAEMAGIKFHGAIDVVIRGNHIYRCGNRGGIWLDWMGQGSQVVGNLLHDNNEDIFLEMQHGPLLVANNLFLSKMTTSLDSQGMAFAHNLIAGQIRSRLGDERTTPFQPAHDTVIAGMYPSVDGDSGDHRFYNNLYAGAGDARKLDQCVLPCFVAGNVFIQGTQPSKFDANALALPEFDAGVKLEQKADGWYLAFVTDKAWRKAANRKLVTTDLLGTAKVTGCAYEKSDGSPLKIDRDYFGQKRDKKNPFPGPFENTLKSEPVKVWPVSSR